MQTTTDVFWPRLGARLCCHFAAIVACRKVEHAIQQKIKYIFVAIQQQSFMNPTDNLPPRRLLRLSIGSS
jgi:hypothetical protein